MNKYEATLMLLKNDGLKTEKYELLHQKLETNEQALVLLNDIIADLSEIIKDSKYDAYEKGKEDERRSFVR